MTNPAPPVDDARGIAEIDLAAIRERHTAIENECVVMGSWIGPFATVSALRKLQAAHEDRRDLLALLDAPSPTADEARTQGTLVDTIVGCFHDFDVDALGRANVHRLVKDIVIALSRVPSEDK